MPIKLGKEQIQKLLDAAIVKFENDTGKKITRNQNPDNYIDLANKLSEISNKLPDDYPEIFDLGSLGKFDITPAQIRNAWVGQVENLKEHFYEALHLYIYDKLSREVVKTKESGQEPTKDSNNQEELIRQKAVFGKRYDVLKAVSAILFIVSLFLLFKCCQFETIKHDMRILPYQPTKAEIESLVGIWKVYSGSPQVRVSDSNRYHMVAWDVLQVIYKNGYFTFNRYGPKIDHQGVMQFERPNLVSIYTDVIYKDTIVPKYSLLELKAGKKILNAMSVSWSWDTSKNVIIGIREVYLKMGEIGSLKPELVIGHSTGKVKWIKEKDKEEILQPQIIRLELVPEFIQPLIDETSIILKEPDSNALPKKHEK